MRSLPPALALAWLCATACGRLGYELDDSCIDMQCLSDAEFDDPATSVDASVTSHDAAGAEDVPLPMLACASGDFSTSWEGGDGDELGASLEFNTVVRSPGFIGALALTVDTTSGSATGFADTGYSSPDSIFHQFYFRADLLPASGADPIFISDSGGSFSSDSIEVRIDSEGHLSIFQRDTSGPYAGTWVEKADMADVRPGEGLRTGVWYLIELTFDWPALKYDVSINAESMLAGDLTSGISDQDRFGWGKRVDYSGTPVIFHYDEVISFSSGWTAGGCCIGGC